MRPRPLHPPLVQQLARVRQRRLSLVDGQPGRGGGLLNRLPLDQAVLAAELLVWVTAYNKNTQGLLIN
jgi:hypothetical protein